ncbi:hypothetical protein [Nocardioides sp. YIM 152588]|uniref:hypothetical protein n=1 Tax=Nocardioides sp. YIM 152588 TaxID=3158259 RepID=UPI0032E3BDCA
MRPVHLALAAGITLSVVAWGYLVYAAIDFGATARQEGDGAAWAFLVLASVGAMACLFLGFMLIVRLSRELGITHSPEPRPKRDPDAPKGGRRASR